MSERQYTNVRGEYAYTPGPRARLILSVTPKQAIFVKTAAQKRDVTISEYMRSAIDALERMEMRKTKNTMD